MSLIFPTLRELASSAIAITLALIWFNTYKHFTEYLYYLGVTDAHFDEKEDEACTIGGTGEKRLPGWVWLLSFLLLHQGVYVLDYLLNF